MSRAGGIASSIGTGSGRALPTWAMAGTATSAVVAAAARNGRILDSVEGGKWRFLRSMAGATSSLLRGLLPGSRDRFLDHPVRVLPAAPAADADPFFRLEVLIMGEEMLDLLAHDRRQIVGFLDLLIIREGGVDRHREDLLVAAGFILEPQHGDRPDPHHAARDERRPRHHQAIERVAVGRER